MISKVISRLIMQVFLTKASLMSMVRSVADFRIYRHGIKGYRQKYGKKYGKKKIYVSMRGRIGT